MKPELEKQLVEKYPKIFQMVGSTPQESCMAWGLAVGDGWYWIIDQLCKQLQWSTDNNNQPQIVAAQVKEKFSGLRFYIDSGTDAQYEVIHFAESLTYGICEYCGSTEDVGQTSGWIKTMCAKCAEKENKELKNDRVKTEIVKSEGGSVTRYTEFPEQEKKQFICERCGKTDAIKFDGYMIAEKMLEDVMIKLTYNNDELRASLNDPADNAYCCKLNMKEYFKEALEMVKNGDLDTGVCCVCGSDAWKEEDE